MFKSTTKEPELEEEEEEEPEAELIALMNRLRSYPKTTAGNHDLDQNKEDLKRTVTSELRLLSRQTNHGHFHQKTHHA